MMPKHRNRLISFLTSFFQKILFNARLSTIRASLWIMGNVWGCGLIAFIFAMTGILAINSATNPFVMQGPSMEPTIHFNDVPQLAPFKTTDQLQRGDIIAFRVPGNPAEEPAYIKRIIGLPGERVEMRDTKVYIDGTELDEPYIAEPCEDARCPNRIWQLGTDEYFVMGDNRNHSSDSRAFGSIKRDRIVAKVLSATTPEIRPVDRTFTAIVATNQIVQTLISATSTAAAR